MNPMQLPLWIIATRMLAAIAAGGIIGTERSIHGRAAGFRTHTLVCMASSVLMLVTVFESQWILVRTDGIRMDPTRMAQGIMTGIGFLGAGVIFKEGLTVRGLTTAASIWMTAAIGILMGIGLYAVGALAAALTLGVLSIFRRLELRFPRQVYARHAVQFPRGASLSHGDMRKLLKEHGFKISEFSYALVDGTDVEYRMAIHTGRPENMDRLAETLSMMPNVRAFTISPSD